MKVTVKRSVTAGIDYTIAEPQHSDASTQTIICLHGIGGDDTSFLAQSESLSQYYRVVAWNMPGYQQSEPHTELTFAGLCEALLQFIDALESSSVILLGQSIGGMIAQDFYHRYPQRVRSLILVATTAAFGGRDDSFSEAFLSARLDPLDDGVSMQQMAQEAIPAIVGTNISDEALRSAIDSMSCLNSDTYRKVIKCLVTFDRFREWSDISCPVCLIAGSEDTNSPAATMHKMASRLPDTLCHEIKGAGHLVNLEKPEEVNEIIRSFIEKQQADD